MSSMESIIKWRGRGRCWEVFLVSESFGVGGDIDNCWGRGKERSLGWRG